MLSVYAGGRHALTSDEQTLAGFIARRAAITLQAPTRRAEQSRARAGRDVPLTNSGGEGIGSSGSTVDNDHATVAVGASALS